ncbi:Vesicle coat complex COPII subunit Sec24 [Encephalitozoon romaleae SJ-2008]|uniref:Vesicle coat complex COPII subunit Sec24 n=1 Tax=Encephalitozoon romaleae (strain SJ-2008) TaxID=1178016 RepID=I7AQL4_ENCRO|nr:Vesicle coat complex COPII subunit Sec24 [Encephalitozoon romaleae SJ-2008]AFN82612.1 Vesicle coat complex COPII subunit Sec24 [Encephalitozoon romaleae SJ-2008]
MHSRDFASQAMHQASKQFPKAFEGQRRPKMKIPDFPLELEKDQASFFSFDTSIQPPPLSTTNCFITETTNTDPNLLRSTMYTLPTDTDTFESMEIPFGLVLNPFNQKAMATELDKEISVRCWQCQSYVNIFTRIEGTVFYCNICDSKNQVKEGISNEVTRYSTIEYVTRTKNVKVGNAELGNMVSENLFRTTIAHGPVFIFGVDTTVPTLMEHAVKAIGYLIKDENFRFLFKKIAVVLFSDAISLIKASGRIITEVLLSDKLQLPFISPEFLMDVEDNELMDLLIEHTTKMPVGKGNLKNGFNDCLKVSISITGYCKGSKMAVFTNTQEKLEEEEIAKQLIEVGCSLSVFSMQKTPASRLCALTTGRSFIYTSETLSKLATDLMNLGTMKSSYKVRVEAKTSDAIRKLSFYGNTAFEHLGFQDFAQMDDKTTFGITFSLEESLKNKSKVYVQMILSFYCFDGSSRVLVMNTSFEASSRISEVYAGLSFDTLSCIYAKYIAMDENTVKEHSKKVENSISRSLKYYRNSCCKEASSSQFVLPESIKLIPLIYQSMLKNSCFSNSASRDSISQVTGFTVEQNLRFFYPRLFAFTDFYIDKSLDKIKALKLTAESLNSEEIYVLDNSQKIYIYIGENVDTSLKEAIFTDKTEENEVLRKMIEEFYSYYDSELPVVFVEEGKGGPEVEFIGYLVEDRLNNIPSYPDYICELHFKVKNA